MGSIDWAKVEREYNASTLDLARLNAHALRVAEALRGKGVQVQGYTDSDAKDFWREASRQGFFKTLFKDRTGLDYRHVGYWVLATASTHSHHTDRKKTRSPAMPSLGLSASSYQKSHGHSQTDQWVLLEDGALARSGWYRKSDGWRSEAEPTAWRVMTTEDILLLDHRARTSYRDYNNRSGTGYSSTTEISSSNYLLTSKKGGGCSKLLTGLLQTHGLLEPGSSRRAGAPAAGQPRSGQPEAEHDAPPRERLPISRTYRLSADQLLEGCTLTHTFTNGTTTRVTIRAATRSGKVITVRTRESGGPEAIRVLAE